MESEVRKSRKQNPRERANPLSALLFVYIFPIFLKNFKKKGHLSEGDLFEALDEHRSKTLADTMEEIWRREQTKRKKYALHFTLFKRHRFELVAYGILQFVNEISLVTLMPLTVGGIISYFESADVDVNQAYIYASLLILGIMFDVLINHSASMGLLHMSMKIAVACRAMVYRKALRISQTTLGQITVGHVVNLISNDAGYFDDGFILFHYTWIAPIQAIIGTYLLYRIVGPSAFAGITFLLIFIPLQMLFGKKKSGLRLKTAVRTDERVTLMNEILNGIQVIKMYTWEKPFAKLISLVRRSEIKAVRATAYLDAITFSLEMVIPNVSTFITIIVYIFLGNTLTAQKVYSLVTIYEALRPTVTIMFSEGVSSTAELHITINRIEEFLRRNELNAVKMSEASSHSSLSGGDLNHLELFKKSPSVVLDNVSASWDQSDMVLSNINLNIQSDQLIAIVGPVGSGKSSIFNVILKELPIAIGSLETKGKISYSCQETWLFSGSVRQNILFGEPYHEDRYKNVIKICCLEQDLTSFPQRDMTIVGESGKMLSGGQKARINLARCLYRKADIYLLDDPLSAVDSKIGRHLYEVCITNFLQGKIRILITHQLQYLKNAHKIIIIEEGRIIGEGTYEQLQSSGLDFAKILHQFQSEDSSERADTPPDKNLAVPESDFEDVFEEERMEVGSIKSSVYWAYLKSGGNYFAICFLVSTTILTQCASSGGDVYLSTWVNTEQQHAEGVTLNEEIDRFVIATIYSAITLATVACALIQSFFFFAFCMRASRKIHDTIFAKILNATMRFFNLNPSGRILNRFSEDLGVIDRDIPGILADVIEIALNFVGTVVVSSIVNPWLLLPTTGLLVAFHILRVIYLQTSRSVKRIEGVTRTPMFNHLTATLQGLSTIRALSATTTLEKEFDDHQDLHSSASYLYIASSKAFTLWLDMICGIFVSGIILSLLIPNTNYYGGDAGLVITQYLGLTGVLQWGMHQWSELENNMTSVERVLEYKKVETEPVRKEIPLQKFWPEHGKVVFQNVSMKYNPLDNPILKNLSFTIHPQEKIGVVGRTGAGKSSILSALFQLYDIDGSIVIDEADTTKMPLQQLRSKISIIPQEPVLFSGTIRKNLDPFEEYNDETLWNALEQVELKSDVQESPFGLHMPVSESGSNFSIGEKQLVCLARALMRNNRVLVMDEATANVDPQTDALIQKTIREQFAGCTVITIAHRLHTIMDSDRILVMKDGKVAEFGHPHKLLHNRGLFFSMVQSTGPTVAGNLTTIAENNYLKREDT